ncbi:MAG: hypothetical protein CBB68_12540 [Rhodospirillaceae bacterium TMED8]|nr:hypothetical protein [Magnetovibrio sp.]OUT48939.1 MAG: hypothetical protein CBB68_12540 [Rhodospirillaceae bacterium TMED8]
MTDINKEQVLKVLAGVVDPISKKGIVSAGMVSGLQVKDGHVAFAIEVDPANGPQMEPLRKEVEKLVYAMAGVLTATVVLTAEKASGHTQPSQQQAAQQQSQHQASAISPLPGVRSIIAVASGKGGVGKSTTSANLALALSANGKKVGLMDADIYGPSMPRMMGITGQPVSNDGKILEAMENYGVKVMSMGFLIEDDTPMIWRGPMVQSALEQMMRDVNWGELDVLVVDLPPGTGDAQLTMAQRVPLTGAVIVSTPQDIALLDARKGLNMFRKVNVPVLGIIENMSYFNCPQCGHRSEIFSHGGARAEADRLACDFLGEIPLDIDIRTTSDKGSPIVISQPLGELAKCYRAIAIEVAGKIDDVLAERETSTPKIIIQ